MGAAVDDVGRVATGQPSAAPGHEPQELDVAQERYDEASDALRKAKKPLLKASEDLATFNAALAAAILAGHLTPEQKEDAVEARVALAAPFAVRVSKFASAYRTLVEASSALTEAEKAAFEPDNEAE
jgi:hypothetical protein